MRTFVILTDELKSLDGRQFVMNEKMEIFGKFMPDENAFYGFTRAADVLNKTGELKRIFLAEQSGEISIKPRFIIDWGASGYKRTGGHIVSSSRIKLIKELSIEDVVRKALSDKTFRNGQHELYIEKGDLLSLAYSKWTTLYLNGGGCAVSSVMYWADINVSGDRNVITCARNYAYVRVDGNDNIIVVTDGSSVSVNGRNNKVIVLKQQSSKKTAVKVNIKGSAIVNGEYIEAGSGTKTIEI